MTNVHKNVCMTIFFFYKYYYLCQSFLSITLAYVICTPSLQNTKTSFFVGFPIVSLAEFASVTVLEAGFTKPVTLKFLLRISLILLAHPLACNHPND